MILLQSLLEMAIPRPKDLAKLYYHGTTKEHGDEIIKDGAIKVQKLTSRKQYASRAGYTYITPSLSYAMIYAGLSPRYGQGLRGFHKAGYVFEVLGSALVDIDPDEDGIGELLHLAIEHRARPAELQAYPEYDLKLFLNTGIANELHQLASLSLTAGQLERAGSWRAGDWAASGKKLAKVMSPELKLKLIDVGTHLAHAGALRPSAYLTLPDEETFKEVDGNPSAFLKHAIRHPL